MKANPPYIDIHTHNMPEGENVAIANVFASQPIPPAASPNTFFSYGIHPWYVDSLEEQMSNLEQACRNSSVIAIGECGFDVNSQATPAIQANLFLRHVLLSERHKKPLIIHCVKSFNELIRIRKQTSPTQAWILHGFNSNSETVKQCLRNNFYFSFGEQLFRPNSNAAIATQAIPLCRIFLETDESLMPISAIYQQYASVCNTPLQQVKERIWVNYGSCFDQSRL